MGGIGSGQHNNHRATYQVVELYDPPEPSLPRYVAAQRIGESAWRVVWQNRDKLPGKLAGWFRELASQGREPMERILLGRAVGLPLRTAFALANFRMAEICRMATGELGADGRFPVRRADLPGRTRPPKAGHGRRAKWRANGISQHLRNGAGGAYLAGHGHTAGSAGAFAPK